MKKSTLRLAASALLVTGILMSPAVTLAQSRGGRSDNRTERRSSMSESRSASGIDRERGVSRRINDRNATSESRINRSTSHNEANHWPKINSGNTSINDFGNRNRNNADARRNNISNSSGRQRFSPVEGNIGNGARPGNDNRPGGNIGGRPGNDKNNGWNFGGGNRPGGRPDNGDARPGKDNRPGGNIGGRPGNDKGHGWSIGGSRPGGRPNDGGFRPGSRPTPPPNHGVITRRPGSWHTPVAPPRRSFRPGHYHIFRPVPPPNYRPWRNAPIISGILGLAFGSPYYTSLDYLFTRGYEIDGYYNNIVYLRNIQELSCFWPDVMLNYDSRQALSSAEFHYSTAYDDLGRFNRLYSNLCARYGQPVTYNEDADGIRSTWYGGNARGFVSLEYFYSSGRYYTTLSYGY